MSFGLFLARSLESEYPVHCEMANFDANSWYQLYSSGGKSQSLTGSPLYDHGKL